MKTTLRALCGALAGAALFATTHAHAQMNNFYADTVINYNLPGYYYVRDTGTPFTFEVATGGVIGEGTVYGSNTMLFTGGRSQGPINLNDSAKIVVRSGNVTGTYGSLYANGVSKATVEGGLVRDLYLTYNTSTATGATATISGGTVENLSVGKNSAATVSGGRVNTAYVDGAFTVTGGSVGQATLNRGSVPNFAPGITFDNLSVNTNTTLTGINAGQVSATGQVSLIGGTYGNIYANNGSDVDTIHVGGAVVARRISGQADNVFITAGTFGEMGNDAAYFSNNGAIRVSGGTFVSRFSTEYVPSLAVSGGTFTDFLAGNGTALSFSGGAVNGTLRVGGQYTAATANISGGTIRDLFVDDNATVTVTGGVISPNTIRTSAYAPGAVMNFVGSNFAVVADGTDANGLFQYVLSGTLQNGDALNTRYVSAQALGTAGSPTLQANGATLSPVVVPEGGTFALLTMGGVGAFALRRRSPAAR